MQTILITGGTGMIGKTLLPFLTQKGYRLIILTRDVKSKASTENIRYAYWNVEQQEIDLAAVQEADYIIHLAGAGVMDKR